MIKHYSVEYKCNSCVYPKVSIMRTNYTRVLMYLCPACGGADVDETWVETDFSKNARSRLHEDE